MIQIDCQPNANVIPIVCKFNTHVTLVLVFKNIYKDTQGYDISSKRPVDPRYWIHQIGKVFETYTNRKFIIFQKDSWELPKAWKHSNVSLDSIKNI